MCNFFLVHSEVDGDDDCGGATQGSFATILYAWDYHGKVLEDEKVKGTVHIVIGSNAGFGGTVQVSSHLDGILLNPTLTIDGQVIIQDGKYVVQSEA